MDAPTQSAVGKLSERAQILIHQELDRHFSADSIARTVSRTTHEKVSPAAIARYAKQYATKVQAKENARVRADYLVGEIIRQGDEVSEMLCAAFHETFARAKKTGALSEMNPLLIEAAERRRLELGLHRKQVSLAERRVQVSEERLHLDREKAHAVIAKLDSKARKGKSLSPGDVRQIREIYGVSDASEHDSRAEEHPLRRREASAPN